MSSARFLGYAEACFVYFNTQSFYFTKGFTYVLLYKRIYVVYNEGQNIVFYHYARKFIKSKSPGGGSETRFFPI